MGADANGSRWVEGLAEDPKDKISQKLKREHLFLFYGKYFLLCLELVVPTLCSRLKQITFELFNAKLTKQT